MRMSSKPVKVSEKCGFKNAGVYDDIEAADAVDLGQGRILQDTGDGTSVLVIDCMASEAIEVIGKATKIGETSCGPDFVFGQVKSPKGPMTLLEGKHLTELAALARQRGLRADEELDYLFNDPWGKPLWRKERVDLLCGCKLYYPESAGAKP